MIDWDDSNERRAFELAAVEAAHGYIEVLEQLHEALERERRLTALLAERVAKA